MTPGARLSLPSKCEMARGRGALPLRQWARAAFPALSAQGTKRCAQNTSAAEKVTVSTLQQKHANGEAVSCVTAYDYPSGTHVHRAGIDACLIGDSAAMVVHGHGSTLPITLQQMVNHCRAVARGCLSPLRIADLPFGSYEQSPEQCLQSASTLVKEGFADAIKLEGAAPRRLDGAEACVQSGIAVMGHLGLTPQSIGTMGGFKPQARSAQSAASIVESAKALERAGAFAIVLECVPEQVAAAVTAEIGVPTIGIGAGRFVSGQVLVYHDLLGMNAHPHHNAVVPRFCKQYAGVGRQMIDGLQQFASEVREQQYPTRAHSPYSLNRTSSGERGEGAPEEFASALQQNGMFKAAEAARRATKLREREESGEPPGRADG